MTPRNEMEVVVMFSQQAQAAGFEIVSVQAGFPDAIVRRGKEEYKVEFEYKSSNFWVHRHNPVMCDLIICWINDDEYQILPIIELSNPDWPKTPIVPPPHQGRLVGYWKARALAAEVELKEAVGKAEAEATQFDEMTSKLIEKILPFIELSEIARRLKREGFRLRLERRSSQEESDPANVEFMDELIKEASVNKVENSN